MDLDGARTLVAGASGALGSGLAAALHDRGARVVVGGRRREALDAAGERFGTTPVLFDAVDGDSCRRAVGEAVDQLGGLDLLVVAVGVAAFGPAVDADAAVVDELFAVNVLGPMSLVRAAAPALAASERGRVAVLSAILADLPTNQMGEYSATKAALSAWLDVLRRENRRAFGVLDVRPPHLDTGLETRALAGSPPPLPGPRPAGEVVDAVVTALVDDVRVLGWDHKQKALVSRGS
ncbi:SDR family oxidoreductase [Nocardioides sp.]|uniref:SDR family NAD(P)-dependent oxidoreductase n=1 Tax=Nocardioides sp. TaxID=35761 RepID=UPI0027237331|nr:SDR family NAD(P)-dependent oxidoreductase [Nocardioides sp.]MDO9457726.1 SDR family NAD(P)-dependent oxidoreductase [Nocardioides sp.]